MHFFLEKLRSLPARPVENWTLGEHSNDCDLRKGEQRWIKNQPFFRRTDHVAHSLPAGSQPTIWENHYKTLNISSTDVQRVYPWGGGKKDKEEAGSEYSSQTYRRLEVKLRMLLWQKAHEDDRHCDERLMSKNHHHTGMALVWENRTGSPTSIPHACACVCLYACTHLPSGMWRWQARVNLRVPSTLIWVRISTWDQGLLNQARLAGHQVLGR